MGEKIKIFLTDAVRRVDWVLLLCTTVLSVISLVTVYGAVDNFGMSKLKMQFAMTVLGIILTFIMANLDYHVILDRLWLPLLLFSAGILGITLVAGDTGAAMETAGIPVDPADPQVQRQIRMDGGEPLIYLVGQLPQRFLDVVDILLLVSLKPRFFIVEANAPEEVIGGFRKSLKHSISPICHIFPTILP